VKKISAFLTIAILLVLTGAGKETENNAGNGEVKPLVTCTTTLLSSVVAAVGADSVEVNTIVPFGMCPGHFDLTPGEADKLRNADILLYHGFEQFLKGIETSRHTRVIKAGVNGNWMIPSIHIQGIESIRAVLSEAMPEMKDAFADRAERYKLAVTEQADYEKKRFIAYRDTPVICSEMNRDMIEWCGLKVIAQFERDEDVSVKTLHKIIIQGKESSAAMVIDNRQSSGKIGETIAGELGIPFVMISNFPELDLVSEKEYPYVKTLSNNCSAILKILKTEE